MSWTDERIATLKKMWEGGSTASQIAEELGGVSRNAVIGKAHRLSLQRGAAVRVPEPEPEPPLPEEKLAEWQPEIKTWMCRWRTDEPGRFGLHICGKTVQPGRHYCAEHLTMSYVQRKRSAA